MEFLNHPLCVTGMALLLVGITMLAPFATQKCQEYWNRYAKGMGFANLLFGHFAYKVPLDEKRSMDMRIYQQDRIVDYFFSSISCAITEPTAISSIAAHRKKQRVFIIIRIRVYQHQVDIQIYV